MRPESQPFHNLVLSSYNTRMFMTLLDRRHIITETPKSYQFEDKDGTEFARQMLGYMAMQDVDDQKTKFFIELEHYNRLPIRIESYDDIFYKESARSKGLLHLPREITPFRITPAKCFNTEREFFDSLAPFQHTHPDMWTLNKIVAVMALIGKTFCGICSNSEFGKSSIYLILDALTKKSPVFQPRSVPGVLAQITGDGNMVFDEVHETAADVKGCMENFSLQVAGNSPIYINGARETKNTKQTYDVSQQSITFLYNVYNHYSEPTKDFWNFIFKNRLAMESRFLCLKFEGRLLEEFDKDFNIPAVAEANTALYIKIAKHLMYLKQLKQRNGYCRRFQNTSVINLTGRHKIIYDEISCGIDLYCQSQEEYSKFTSLLNDCIIGYAEMLGTTLYQHCPEIASPEQQPIVEELVCDEPFKEFVDKNDVERLVLERVAKDGECEVHFLIDELGITDEQLRKMISRADLFESRPGFVRCL